MLRFFYSGEKCDDKTNYTMNVMLHCDYSGSKNDFLGAFHASGKCEATIVLRSPHACLPTHDNLKNVVCVAKSPSGEVFNFNSLRNTNHKASAKDGTFFTIAICNPVLYGHEAACDAGTSVCRVDPKATDLKSQYRNMGIMTEAFKFKDKFISLTLTGGEQCDSDRKYRTKIFFECDPLAGIGEPQHHTSADCVNVFSWPTSLACVDKKPCQVVNGDSGVSFDFSSLAGIQYEAVKKDSEEKIIFSICTPANEPCMKQSGSCIFKNKNNQSTQAGIANDNLMLEIDDKSPYLVYKYGAVCKKHGTQYTTRINFVCADNAEDEGAVVVEDGCEIVIEFKTLLACANIKDCIAKGNDDEVYDLSPLIDYENNYLATVDAVALPNETAPVQYYLNVCRPLNSKYSLNCRGLTGACRTVLGKDGKNEQEISLGHPDYSLTTVKVNGTNEVTMMYFDGSPCLTDNTEKSATIIRFYCDQKVGYGNPILSSIEYCMYSFDFPTNILCKEESVEMKNDSCSLVNNNVSVSIDLKLFGSNGVYQVDGKDVNICGGAGKFYTIVYKQSMVRIEFSQGKLIIVQSL